MKIMQTLIAAATCGLLLASLSANAFADEEHEHDPQAKCTWQADTAPTFLPGSTTVNDTGSVTTTVFGSTVRRCTWNVQVQPAYQYGWVYAWDTALGVATFSKSAAASSQYNVVKSADCCLPTRSVKPTATVGFDLRATSDGSDATGRADGASRVFGTNTGVTVTGADGVTTKSADDGATVRIPIGSGSVQVTLGFGSSDETTASVAVSGGGPWTNAPDEEYLIDTNLMVKATADGAMPFYPLMHEDATARIFNHSIWIETALQCSHCGQSMVDRVTVDKATNNVTESTPQ